MSRELLNRLLCTASVSGCEEANQRHILAYGAGFADRQTTDAVGNVINIVNPDAGMKVLLCGHIDEIGFRVTQIDDRGYIRVQKAGGVRPALYVGSRMQIIHTDEENGQLTEKKVTGIVAVTSELIKSDNVKDSDLVIDIGAKDKAQAEQFVSVGDPVCQDIEPADLLNGMFTGRALDDKTGAWVVVEAARRAKAYGSTNGIYAVTSVGEETSGRGAFFAGAKIQPSCAIAVDVTWASDCPGTDPASTGDVRLGKGPVLCHSGMVNKAINRRLAKVAEEFNIPVQYEVAGGSTYTDGDSILRTGEGVPMALVSIPLRYMHSSAETASYEDLENAAELIARFLVSLDENFSFDPLG